MNLYLSRVILNESRVALSWIANPYRVHQRLSMACERDPRLLFRIEELPQLQILVQSHNSPDWSSAFKGFNVLAHPPQTKMFSPQLAAGGVFHFRLLANPSYRHEGDRLGILDEAGQLAWLQRKLADSGAELINCNLRNMGFQRSEKNPAKESSPQTHLSVLFDGELRVVESPKLLASLAGGIGPAKAYGFGLLSLAVMRQ